MNEKNIENIKMQLVSLGLPADIEYELKSNICLQPNHFQVHYTRKIGEDTMKTIFHFEKNENIYSCRYYEAWLRKEIPVPSLFLNEVDVSDLQTRMSKINWNIQFSNSGVNHIQTGKGISWEIEEAIETIVTDLKKLATTPEGLQIADCLKMKFWSDSKLVFLIPNINVLKNQYEISQRFYFFDDEGQITLDEAYRFLSLRWREKQLNAKNKHTETPSESENENSSIGPHNPNNLLKKERISKRKNLKHLLR